MSVPLSIGQKVAVLIKNVGGERFGQAIVVVRNDAGDALANLSAEHIKPLQASCGKKRPFVGNLLPDIGFLHATSETLL